MLPDLVFALREVIVTSRNFFVPQWFNCACRPPICPVGRQTKKRIMKTKAAFTLIEIMFVVAIIGLLAAIAIPNLTEAIATSRAQACALNRKNIDAAKLRWSVANNQPTDVAPTEQDLFGRDAFIEHKPNCPAGGIYAINTVHERCTCTVVRHTNQPAE